MTIFIEANILYYYPTIFQEFDDESQVTLKLFHLFYLPGRSDVWFGQFQANIVAIHRETHR